MDETLQFPEDIETVTSNAIQGNMLVDPYTQLTFLPCNTSSTSQALRVVIYLLTIRTGKGLTPKP